MQWGNAADVAEESIMLGKFASLETAIDHYANTLGFTLKAHHTWGLGWFYVEDESGIGVVMARPCDGVHQAATMNFQNVSTEPVIFWGKETAAL